MDSKRRNATKVVSGEIPPQVVQQMKQNGESTSRG